MKLLVANRSEIACRVFQACRELGIRTVAVCASGDEQARHVTMADEVEPVSSYLDIPALQAAIARSGAKLVHPGYGFLSERAAFARAVEASGAIFLGPSGDTMDALGAKIAAKELAAQAGVPTLPWAKVPPGSSLREAAQKVGFPLLLKASAGGGGKGMRRVDRAEDLESAAESASAEAVSAFGDGTLFLERLVEKPRHIEVQVFGDGLGGAVHLYERECSLQRRHQKVWEEARAPLLGDDTRAGLHEASLRLAQAVRYRSAGTIEFLVDAGGGFYFLEMNTRLQVEHPVTEAVTGVDLVHAQIELGLAGKKGFLPQVSEPRGHAIEVRLYAEDPAQGFIPTPGRVDRLRWPTGTGIRVDSGIEEGQVLGTQFDSMLGKLIVHAPSRERAIARMRYALSETVILGVGTNQSYLSAIAHDPVVASGKVHTGYLGSEFQFTGVPESRDLELLAEARKQGYASTRSSQAVVGESSSPSPWQKTAGEKGASRG